MLAGREGYAGKKEGVGSMDGFTYMALDPVMSGKKIKSIINQSGYSIRQVQVMLGMAWPQPIYRWVKGKRMPTLDHLYMMHKIFGVHMEDMLVAVGEEK